MLEQTARITAKEFTRKAELDFPFHRFGFTCSLLRRRWRFGPWRARTEPRSGCPYTVASRIRHDHVVCTPPRPPPRARLVADEGPAGIQLVVVRAQPSLHAVAPLPTVV
jgi:hypothetical protein